jgi:thioredoxin 1
MTDNDKVKELSNSEFQDFTKHKLVLIDFSADWCMPCLIMDPVIDELSDKFKGKIKFGKVDVSENHEIARKFEVFSIPTFILFKNGEIADRFMGAMPLEEFEEKLKKHL